MFNVKYCEELKVCIELLVSLFYPLDPDLTKMLPVLGSFIQVLIFNASIVKAFSIFSLIFFNLEKCFFVWTQKHCVSSRL